MPTPHSNPPADPVLLIPHQKGSETVSLSRWHFFSLLGWDWSDTISCASTGSNLKQVVVPFPWVWRSSKSSPYTNFYRLQKQTQHALNQKLLPRGWSLRSPVSKPKHVMVSHARNRGEKTGGCASGLSHRHSSCRNMCLITSGPIQGWLCLPSQLIRCFWPWGLQTIEMFVTIIDTCLCASAALSLLHQSVVRTSTLKRQSQMRHPSKGDHKSIGYNSRRWWHISAYLSIMVCLVWCF